MDVRKEVCAESCLELSFGSAATDVDRDESILLRQKVNSIVHVGTSYGGLSDAIILYMPDYIIIRNGLEGEPVTGFSQRLVSSTNLFQR